MTTKTRSNEEMIAFRKNHFLPTASLYHKEPLHLTKAQGQYVWDAQGKKYLDGIGGIVCISAGHNHPRIKKALAAALERDQIQHTSTLYLSDPAIDAAEALLEEAPAGLDRVAFTNSGSEANELAIMAARHATGETAVLNLRHSYHGGTSGTLANCGHHTWRFKSQPVMNTVSVQEPNCYRCPYQKTKESCALECAKDVERAIQTATNGKIAAMIVEPVMGVGGFITPPEEYFPVVTKTVHNYGGKYISDEVQTGAGRCGGNFLLTKELKIDADMVTMAKGFGNGAAVGGVLMKSDTAEKMTGRLYFNTFGADPHQMIQAKETMAIIKDEKLVANSREMGKLLVDGMLELQKRFGVIGDVRGRGLLLGMELVKDRATKAYATDEAVRFMDECKDRGLLLGKGGLMGNVVRIAPPMNITRDDVKFMLETMADAFTAIEKAFGKVAL
ncbi:MAG: aspartate aminotransferase family protein [Bdellovibrionales bacterium]|nr:aspartate aminotransferase family protein [Bdellovibrionales bacterium]